MKPRSNKTFLVPLLVSLLLSWGALAGEPAPVNSRSAAFSRAAEAGKAATVGVYYEKDRFSLYYGTGVVISANGYILTSTTVVLPGGEGTIEVYFADHTRRPAKFVESAPEAEATLLKVEATGLAHVPLAPGLPKLGERAYSFANARHSMRSTGGASFSAGRITGIYPVGSDPGLSSYEGLAIETDAAINPGQDGGPLLNAGGQLTGIVSLSFSDARWLGVAVPIGRIRGALSALKDQEVPTSSRPILQPFPPDREAGEEFRQRAREFAPALVRLQVKRRYEPQKMPRYFWPRFLHTQRETWEEANDSMRARLIGIFTQADRILGANQQIRRPADPVTGTLISPDGYILTSQFNVETDTAYIHKEDGLQEVSFDWDLDALLGEPDDYRRERNPVQSITAVLSDGRALPAEIISRHRPLKVALLKVEAQALPHVDVSEIGANARLGQEAAALGIFGQRDRVTLNPGITTASARQRGHFFQFGGRINYGNSGGAVIDRAGNLLGIATEPLRPGPVLGMVLPLQHIVRRWYMAPNSGISFAARIDRITEALPRLKAGTSVQTLHGAFIGVAMDPTRVFSEGAFVGQVVPNSPAQRAGLRPGDQILAIGEHGISSWKDLTATVQGFEVGDRVILGVRRLKETYRRESDGNGQEEPEEPEGSETDDEESTDDPTGHPEEEEQTEAATERHEILEIPLTLGERE